MRIIAGEKKGLTLSALHGNWIRPTSDKIRGAIFSSLFSYFSHIDGFIDCFSGSGAMAIEAASRGIDNVFCFDKSRKSYNIMRQNIKKARYNDLIKAYNISAQDGLKMLGINHIKADIFFMDPPYKKLNQIYELIEMIKSLNIITENGFVVIEHDKSDIIQTENYFEIFKEKKYGNTVVDYITLLST